MESTCSQKIAVGASICCEEYSSTLKVALLEVGIRNTSGSTEEKGTSGGARGVLLWAECYGTRRLANGAGGNWLNLRRGFWGPSKQTNGTPGVSFVVPPHPPPHAPSFYGDVPFDIT